MNYLNQSAVNERSTWRVKSKGNAVWYFAACLKFVRFISTYLFLTLEKMCSHKVKTCPCFSMILEVQKQRDIHSNAKNIDLDLAVSSICPFGQMTSIC